MIDDLFADHDRPSREVLGDDACLLRAWAVPCAEGLLAEIAEIMRAAPLRQMVTPGGFTMSVAMTNCGAAGWITDRTGYRYARHDPLTGLTWPEMRPLFVSLAREAAEAAGFAAFEPDACLINCYRPGARLTLHQDRNERDFSQPIVSVSLGLPATFLFGGLGRDVPVRKFALHHGDVAVWGGSSRLAFHGVSPLRDGVHPDLGRQRINLTFRRAC